MYYFFVSENEFYIDLYIEYAFTAGMKYKMYSQIESFTVSVISIIYSLSRNFIMFRNVKLFQLQKFISGVKREDGGERARLEKLPIPANGPRAPSGASLCRSLFTAIPLQIILSQFNQPVI